MIGKDLYREFLRVIQRKWPQHSAIIVVTLISLVSALLLIAPGAIIEIIENPSDKTWAAIFLAVITTAILYPIYLSIYVTIKPVVVPRIPRVNVFFPVNDYNSRGDALLQYAGFEAARAKFNDNIDIRLFDSSKDDWLFDLEQCIYGKDVPDDSPVWIIVAMSSYGKKARERIEAYLKKDPRLKERLTAIFTVSSSKFETSDRRNLFRIFVDGETEVTAIAEYIELNLSPRSNEPLICFRVDSNYGRDAEKKLFDLFGEKYEIRTCDKNSIEEVDFTGASVVVAIAYDLDLRTLFSKLKSNGFKGHVFGTTPMSVPDWKKLFDYDPANITVMHTSVSGFDNDPDFQARLAPINVEYLINRDEELIKGRTAHRLRDDAKEYAAYSSIESNYISAFCEDCVRLFELASRKGHPTLYSMLSDPSCDSDRRNLTTLRDLDFGVTGEAHVSVFLRKA
ncbi:MAG: hypothetical protein AB3N63_16640 [Puniceicoccaceae bacterium]